MSATARRRGAGKRWDIPAAPAVPNVVKPAKANNQAAKAAPKTVASDGGVDTISMNGGGGTTGTTKC